MTYHPEEKDFTTIHGKIHRHFEDNTGYSLDQDFSNDVTYESRWQLRGGGNSPNWPRQKSINSYEFGKTETHLSPFSLRATYTGSNYTDTYEGSQTWHYSSPANDGVYLPYLSTALGVNYGQVVNKILSNLSQNKVNIAQFFAEREQTKNLVASTAHRIADSLLALRKGNFAGAARNLLGSKGSRGIGRGIGGIPEQWLALQYGWKPLLSDVYGACEELAALTTGVEPEAYSAKGHATTSLEKISYDVPGDGGWVPPMKWSNTSAQIRGFGVVNAKVGAQVMSIASRTGIANPIKLEWELLPYSFVVDWFYPVGDFLDQCNATDGFQFLSGYIVQKVTVNWNGRLARHSFTDPSGWVTSASGGDSSASSVTYKRTALSGFPRARWPDFKDPFSSTHVANALSLLATAFGRGPRVR